jgi:putative membrane protein
MRLMSQILVCPLRRTSGQSHPVRPAITARRLGIDRPAFRHESPISNCRLKYTLADGRTESSQGAGWVSIELTRLLSPSCAAHNREFEMIRNFADHSANERTFLAWVRTAIAVMAFGFLVERFDLFLLVASPGLGAHMPSLPGERFGNRAGLALIILGTLIVATAAARFLITARKIDSAKTQAGPGSRVDLALAALLALLGCALFVYLSHALVTKV